MDNKKVVRYLFAQAIIEKRLKEIIDLTTDQYEILLIIRTVGQYTDQETVNILTARKFMRKFLRNITTQRFNKTLDSLHDNNLVWINSLKTVTITKLGTKAINEIYWSIYDFEYHPMKDMFKALTSGVMTKDGDLIFPENLRKHNPNNPYNKYIGVHRLKSHLWGAYIKVEGKEIFLGAFKKPIEAAKARDKYIAEKKLKHKKSINTKD